MNVNIYDFDGTIYRGDSTFDFYMYCLRKRPYIIVFWPLILIAALLWAVKLINKTKMKRVLYLYFYIVDVEKLVPEFWKEAMKNIYPWYYERHTENDIVVSASPEFSLKYPCEKLGIKKLICTVVDAGTGKHITENCSGPEKKKRFLAEFPEAHVDNAYYDKDRDLFVSRLAGHKYRIVHGKSVEE